MYEITYLGRWETLPETAAAICDHDMAVWIWMFPSSSANTSS